MTTASSVKFREYDRIFTGSNQDVGYTNPILGYTSETVLQVFPTDTVTYFHYPITAPSGLLVESSLVNDGAVCAEFPYASDKIWKKMANYSSTSIWGNAMPIGKQTGVWLCSWLSGNVSDPDTTPVWKDRWYNPGYIDAQTAMFVPTPQSGVILDIDSEMTFEAGSYYKYFHVGSQHNETIVTTLTSNSALKLHLDDWSSNPVDSSVYNNTTTVINYTPACVSVDGVNQIERPSDTCLNLNGDKQYAQVLYSNSYTLTGDMTCSFWAYSEDWTNQIGSSLISKDHRGGWAVKYNNGFSTPFIVASDSAKGKYAIMNTNGDIIVTKTLPTSAIITSIEIDSNKYIWVLDNGLKRLYKSDLNSDLKAYIQFGVSTDLTKLALDENENICVLDTTTSRISAFDRFTQNLVEVKSGLFYESYMGNSHFSYLSGYYEVPFTPSGIAIIHNGYFNFNDSYSMEKRLSNSIKSSNIPMDVLTALDWNDSGLWLGQTTQQEHYGVIWSGKLQVPVDGIYTFRTYGDDYLKLSANNVLIASAYYIDGQVETSYYFNASAIYDVRVEMGEWQSMDYFNLDWKTTVIPSMSAYQNFGRSTYLTPNGSGVNNFTIDLNGAVVGYDCTDLLVDNDNNQWVLKNNNLYRNTVLIDSTISATKIICNKDNNIWLLRDNTYWKLDGTTYEKTSGTFNNTRSVIDFTNEYYNGSYVDYLWSSSESDQKVYKTTLDGTVVKSIDLSTFDISPNITKMTAYDWNRKFNYLKNNKQPKIQTEIYFLGNDKTVHKETLTIPTSAISNNAWHLFTFNVEGQTINYYVDALLRDSVTTTATEGIYYEYENPLLIGTEVGKITDIQEESKLQNAYFKGKFDDLRIYDTALNNSSIRYIYLNKFDYHNLEWNMDSGNQNYLEEIARFFKFKLPGSKSPYYNIKLRGLNVYNTEVRDLIEGIIKRNLTKIVPAYAELFKIVWE
jgi:hypothetical protein